MDDPFLRAMRRGLAAAVTVIGLAADTGPAAAAHAQDAAPAPRALSFGLAHVDVMELHIQRQPDGPPALNELLSPAEMAERYQRAADTGAAWHRWSFYQDLITGDNGFTWDVADGIVERDVAYGMQTLGILQGSPNDSSRPIFERADGGLADDPAEAARVNGDNTWAQFVSSVVTRYMPGGELARLRGWGGRTGVPAWEIGNEPNVAHFWPGTVAEYVRFLEVAYLVIKWHDPTAVVVHGGIGDDANAHDWYQRFVEALRARAQQSPLPAKHNYYFDRMAWHWYTQRSNLVVSPQRARMILLAQGLPEKPIWVTELGLPVWSEYPGPCWDAASPGRATLAEQAAFVWQALAEGPPEKVEVMIYFQLYDDCGNGVHSYDALGLVRNHFANQCWAPVWDQGCWRFEPSVAGMPRPAFGAFRVAVDLLSGAQPVRSTSAPGDTWHEVVFQEQPDRRTTVAWNKTRYDRWITLAAASDRAVRYSIEPTGVVRSQPATAVNGSYRMLLPAVTSRNGPGGTPLTGGRPVILVEQGTGGRGDAAREHGAALADTAPPYLAVVRELPRLSLSRFSLQVMAGDDAALDAFIVYYAAGGPATTSADWRPLIGPRPWPGSPQAGVVEVPFEGRPGQVYYFSAQAGDRAGNWTPLPTYAQTATRIAGSALGSSRDGGSARDPPRATSRKVYATPL